MTKALGYFFVFMLLCGACVDALAGPVDTTNTTVPSTIQSTTTIAIATTVPISAPESTTPSTGKPSKSNSTSGGGGDINCDDAEDLYDAGNNDDLADYCDYGPDGEWDTEDNYDNWEE